MLVKGAGRARYCEILLACVDRGGGGGGEFESRQRRADRGDAKDPPKKWQLTLVEESGQRGRCRDKAEGGGNAQDNGEHRRGKRPAQEAVKDAPR